MNTAATMERPLETPLADEVTAYLQEQAARLALEPELEQFDPATLPRVAEAAPLPVHERVLTEADNLNRYRLADGSHHPRVLRHIGQNLQTCLKEGPIRTLSRAFQEYVPDYEDEDGRRPTYIWLGRTAIQVARSGRAFYKAPEIIPRGFVEEDEAAAGEKQQPGELDVFLSLKASRADAPYDVAKAEHVADQDAVRISWLDVDEHGRIRGKNIESVLVDDVPLEAWVAWLSSPTNIFGKAIVVENPQSALSVMKTFSQLKLPEGALPEGVISLLLDLLPHVEGEQARTSLKSQIIELRLGQEDKHAVAESIAQRWLEFEVALADSLHSTDGLSQPQATAAIEHFVNSLEKYWNDDDLVLIKSHRNPDGSLRMSRELAVRLEEAWRHTLMVSAAVATSNEKVVRQLDGQTVERIRTNERLIQMLWAAGQMQQARALETQNQQLIAAQEEVTVSGYCPGDSTGNFRTSKEKKAEQEGEQERKNWKLKYDKCVVSNCPTRPGKVQVGPCGVCMGRCQKIYDRGGDPTKSLSLKMIIRTDEKPKNA